MPFQVTVSRYDKIVTSILKFIYSIFVNKSKNKNDFDFSFFNWIEKLGINVPYYYKILGSKLEIQDARKMLKDHNDRILKVSNSVHSNKYKFERQKKIKVDTDSFIKMLDSISNSNFKFFYVKYLVDAKKTGKYETENFKIYFSGLNTAQDLFYEANSGDFYDIDNNGIINKLANSTAIKSNDTFKEKNKELIKEKENGKLIFKEFDECEMGGLIHEINFDLGNNINFGVLNWAKWVLAEKKSHFYIYPCCDSNPTFVNAKCSNEGKYLTSLIFSIDNNLTLQNFKISNAIYYDKGQGCCP